MANSGFWETMNILVGKEWQRSGKEVMDDVQDWVNRVIVKKEISLEEQDEKVDKRRMSDASYLDDSDEDEAEVKRFFKSVNLPPIKCNFWNPQVRSRLERLMCTNIVSLTDRTYMQRLQKRILEDYEESMNKRIKAREDEEMERVKNLVLIGEIPLEEAPPEMATHPIMIIENHCTQLIAERRAKIKKRQVKIPKHLYLDDTPDPPSGLSIEEGHIYRPGTEKLCVPVDTYLGASEEEDISNGYMFNKEEYDRQKYESPLIKQLMNCQTVEEMYNLADNILGYLKPDVSNEVAPTSIVSIISPHE